MNLGIERTRDIIGEMSKISEMCVSTVLESPIRKISLSVNALDFKDKQASDKLYDMDDTVDLICRKLLIEIVTARKESQELYADPRCAISALHILRYLERIADVLSLIQYHI